MERLEAGKKERLFLLDELEVVVEETNCIGGQPPGAGGPTEGREQ